MDTSLWTEKYRPKDVDMLDIPNHMKEFVKNAKDKDFPHLLLYGPAGTGKTTFAMMLNPTFILNASDERGINVIRETIKKISMNVKRQVIILDECENLTKDAQTCLRRILEDFSNTRFIFITNYVSKIIAPIRSRLLKFKFTNKNNEVLKRIAEKENIKINAELIDDIFIKCNKDLRKSINILQSLKPQKCNPDVLIGIINEEFIEKFWKTSQNDFKDFINSFLFQSFSVIQFITQLNNNLKGNDFQKAEFSRILSECEGKCFVGCSDHLVLSFLVVKKIEIYNK